MSIDRYRGGFLTVIFIALLITALGLHALLASICAALIAGCAIILSRLPEREVGYGLGLFSLILSAVAGLVVADAWLNASPFVDAVAALSALALAGLWLVRSWNQRIPVLNNLQTNISTIFGIRKVRGPTRMRRPSKLLGSRIISTISLRPLKAETRVSELDVRPAASATGTTIHVVRPSPDLPVADSAPTKIHAIDLTVGYRLNGDEFFLLRNIPHPDRYTSTLAHANPTQPEYWNALSCGYLSEEVGEVLRRVIQRGGWSASEVRDDQRELVAEQLLSELQAEVASKGIIVEQAELLTVDVDSAATLRAARDTSVYGLERAEQQSRLGHIHVGLHKDILKQMHDLLSDLEHPLPPEAIAAIVRAQIRELGRAATAQGDMEEILEESFERQPDPLRGSGGSVGRPRPHPHIRDRSRDAA